MLSIRAPTQVNTPSNTLISPTECRYSVTHYNGAGLFRWVDNDFQPDKGRKQQASAEELQKCEKEGQTRWEEGLALFLTYQEIVSV
jgi:hypothetical protein